jgi:hypothetical protein
MLSSDLGQGAPGTLMPLPQGVIGDAQAGGLSL